jgi:cobalt-zinc-cadmium efflux system membrane fusion protein
MKNMSIKIFLALAASVALSAATAGEGHDHGDTSAAPASNAPRRQADGSVFLPKPSQRQLGVRTLLTESRQLPQTVELTGRVLMDANAGGRVQPTQAGRIEATAGGLPQLGQAVRKGQVLAVVRSSSGAIERANQQAQTAELGAQLEQARRRAARLAQLEGTVPQKDIDAARADVGSLEQRLAAVSRSVSASETLTAPITGVISSANVVAGQVVDAREVLFEIVDPSRLVVEAQAFDMAALVEGIASASASPAAGVSVPLRFAGAGRTQREGAIPLIFRTAGAAAVPLAVNQPVKVVVQTRKSIQGIPVPSASLVKGASNQDMVWVHTEAETFVPRTVRTVALDGAIVSVVDGLKPGERVVTQGAALVNQVR